MQLVGDVGVGMPLADRGRDLVFAGGERGEPAPCLFLPGGRVGVRREVDEAAGDAGDSGPSPAAGRTAATISSGAVCLTR